MRTVAPTQGMRLQSGIAQAGVSQAGTVQKASVMSVYGFSVPASPTLRSLVGFGLLVMTAFLFLLVVQFEQQTGVQAADAATLKTYGIALLFGAAVMFDIAWFSAVVRTQASEGQDRSTELTGG